jgi:hypothetical protein
MHTHKLRAVKPVTPPRDAQSLPLASKVQRGNAAVMIVGMFLGAVVSCERTAARPGHAVQGRDRGQPRTAFHDA